MHPDRSPIDPNKLPVSNLIASARGPFQEIMGFNSSLLTSEEAAQLRPLVDAVIARDWGGEICLRKAHDAYTHLPDGRPLMGERPDFKAIYIMRNPWDVAISAANHWDLSINDTVKRMCNYDKKQRQNKDVSDQFSQHLLSWSEHVLSWLGSPMDVCLIHYEDMHFKPLETFRKAVRFLGLNHCDTEIKAAIKASEFRRLQQIEKEDGFVETPRKKTRFFRKGVEGEGLERLTPDQLSKMRDQRKIVDRALNELAD